MSKFKRLGTSEHELVSPGPSSSPDDDEQFGVVITQGDDEEHDPDGLRSTHARIQPIAVVPVEGRCSRSRLIAAGAILLLAVVLAIIFAPKPFVSHPIYTIIKSPADARSYRYLQLESNSLPVLLISDPKTEKSSCAMSVSTGSSSDFPKREGLAHFLEHMLFLGSAAYPELDGYNSALQQHGGNSNAWTAEEQTNYFFDLQASEGTLSPILSRFSGFFTSPLLSPSGAANEMKAVASEHGKNVRNDDWRAYAMLHELAEPGSAFNHFGTGTIATLNHSSIVDDLREFWKKYYVANRMNLVLLGRETLNELESFATEHFSGVPGLPLSECGAGEDDASSSAGAVDPNSPGEDQLGARRRRLLATSTHRPLAFDVCVDTPSHPFSPASSPLFFTPAADGQRKNNVTWIPAGDLIHTLSVYFPLPSSKSPLSRLRSDPYGYLSYVLGHEGSATTMVSRMKNAGWVQTVAVGLTVDSNAIDQALFAIEIRLTSLGNVWENRQKIVEMVFQEIELLKKTPLENDEGVTDPFVPQATHAQLHATYLAEYTSRFTFKEKEQPISYTSNLASRMTTYLPFGLGVENILMPPEAQGDWNGPLVQAALDAMTPQNMILLWSSSDLHDQAVKDAVAPDTEWRTEPWYNIVYTTQAFPPEFFTQIAADVQTPPPSTSTLSLTLPPLTNPFLPSLTASPLYDWNQVKEAGEQKRKDVWENFDPVKNVPVRLKLASLTAGEDEASNKLFYKPDLYFHRPHAYLASLVTFPAEYLRDPSFSAAGLSRQVQFQLYRAVLDDTLNAVAYQLGLAGYDFSVEAHPARVGLSVLLSGPSAGIDKVWRKLLARVTDMVVTDNRLAQIIAAVYDSAYQTFRTDPQPYEHALYYAKLWEERTKATVPDLDKAYNATLIDLPSSNAYSQSDLQAFVDNMFTKFGVTTYAYGNLNATEARSLHSAFVELIGTPPAGSTSATRTPELPKADYAAVESANAAAVFQFTPASSAAVSAWRYNASVLNPSELNSALIWDLQVSSSADTDEELKGTLKLMLLDQILSASVFTQLRTIDTLGYIVRGRIRESIGQSDFIQRNYEILVQSPDYNPVYLQERVERFIAQNANQMITTLTQSNFTLQTSTLAYSIQQSKDSSLSMSKNFDTVWYGKIVRDLDTVTFDREDKELALLKEITLSELQSFFAEKFLSPARRKLVIAVYGQKWPLSTNLSPAVRAADPEVVISMEKDVLIADSVRAKRMEVLHWTTPQAPA